jgi:hypothetical protein
VFIAMIKLVRQVDQSRAYGLSIVIICVFTATGAFTRANIDGHVAALDWGAWEVLVLVLILNICQFVIHACLLARTTSCAIWGIIAMEAAAPGAQQPIEAALGALGANIRCLGILAFAIGPIQCFGCSGTFTHLVVSMSTLE